MTSHLPCNMCCLGPRPHIWCCISWPVSPSIPIPLLLCHTFFSSVHTFMRACSESTSIFSSSFLRLHISQAFYPKAACLSLLPPHLPTYCMLCTSPASLFWDFMHFLLPSFSPTIGSSLSPHPYLPFFYSCLHLSPILPLPSPGIGQVGSHMQLTCLTCPWPACHTTPSASFSSLPHAFDMACHMPACLPSLMPFATPVYTMTYHNLP